MNNLKKSIISLATILLSLLCNISPCFADDSCRLYLDIAFNSNIAFDKYDVDLYLDNAFLSNIDHGRHFTKLITTSSGSHTISFYKTNDRTVSGSWKFSISQDSTLSCSIKAEKKDISINNPRTYASIKDAFLVMPNMLYMKVSVAESRMRSCGFINCIFEADSGTIMNKSNWIIVSQSVGAGKEIDCNQAITFTCTKSEDFVLKKSQGKSIPKAEEIAEQFGFIINNFKSVASNKTISFSSSDKELWVITSCSESDKKITFCAKYTGEVVVPDVVGKKLTSAIDILQSAEFSNISYSSEVWNKGNWVVVKQSIPAGTKTNADSSLFLGVEKK